MPSDADGPLARYQAALDSGRFEPDPAQAAAVEHLQRLHGELQEQSRQISGLRKLGCLFGLRPAALKGLYLWGPVGRGKTWLMDLLYDSNIPQSKRRLHFHEFMRRVNQALKKYRDRPDPLQVIAADWAEKCRLLCLDEFQVTDIGDAMLLGGLLEGLFEAGVTLVTTSNTPPEDLYAGGLQRARFLPTIDLITQHLDTVELASSTDYRLRYLNRAQVWHVAEGKQAEQTLDAAFERLNPGSPHQRPLQISGRRFNPEQWGDGIVWFDFEALCEQPVGSADYLELARRFNTLLLEGVPVMGSEAEDSARRFINLIDTLYDQRVKLIVSAAAKPEKIYAGKRLAGPFQRCRSRLVEMQSEEYLALPHGPTTALG